MFFIRPAHGGAVWFDEMGPPWPKHACMDDRETARTHPEPSEVPVERLVIATAPGWQRVRGLSLQDDVTWDCFAVLVNGHQFAMPIPPTGTLSGHFVSWTPPSRLYGEFQYLTETSEGIEEESIPICSYRVMMRSKLNSARAINGEDWQAFRSWIRSLPGLDPRTARLIISAVRDLMEEVGPGWVKSPSVSHDIALRAEDICRKFGGMRHAQLFRWIRLFLA